MSSEATALNPAWIRVIGLAWGELKNFRPHVGNKINLLMKDHGKYRGESRKDHRFGSNNWEEDGATN